MGIDRRCTRCGRSITSGVSGRKEDGEAVEIRRVRVTLDGRVEAQGNDGQGASNARRGDQEIRGEQEGRGRQRKQREQGKQGKQQGKQQRKGKAGMGRANAVAPHVDLTSSDESHKLLCYQCLWVLLPLLFPTHPQPSRLTVGLEDARLIRGLQPAILAVCGPGHMEIEQVEEGALLAHFYTAVGTVESYTVGRAGDLVRIPGQRLAGTSEGRRVHDGEAFGG